MSDRIVLDGMAFRAIHGVNPEEQVTPQRFEVDIELALDLGPAGRTDDLARTIDYGRVYDRCRDVVETRHFGLIEALAEAIAADLLAGFPVDEVTVRVRKPDVRLGGELRSAGVEIRRGRAGGERA
jgi:dihydroneopterin aldolase